MTGGFFITGTDTGVGKTWATVALMRHLQSLGSSVLGMKPVAAGCFLNDGQWQNDDALLLQENGSLAVDYTCINPYALKAPVSPHIAAAEMGCTVQLEEILRNFYHLRSLVDIVLVEGAGGWFAPLNDRQDIADLAAVLELPVILVVAIRLGCINHAKLSYQAILASGQPCAGWIAVCSEQHMLAREQNIATIRRALDVPLLGILPYTHYPDFNFLSKHLQILP